MIKKQATKGVLAVFLLSLTIMLWFYAKGYENSIGWDVTTSAEIIDYPAIKVDGMLLDFEVWGEKYLLTERYSGSPIIRDHIIDSLWISLSWVGVCIVLVGASFLKRLGFIVGLALFTLLLNRLNLHEIGLFGFHDKWIVFIPFVAILGPLFYFHEYRPSANFLTRLVTILIASLIIIAFGISEPNLFVDHFTSHSLFSLSIAGLLFIFILAEENVFALLLITTQGTQGKNNHWHFSIMSLIYLLNLILYYLNKTGYVPNSFSFFDPYLLLVLSAGVAIWTLPHKSEFLSKYFPNGGFQTIFYGLGIILFSILGLSFFRGTDAIQESFHYFILYFHIGFGMFFFLYIIFNFIDPLVKGLSVYKIAYKEQSFPYVSARLGGLAAILGFYFLATQEPYDLLKSGYYSNLGMKETTSGNINLASEFYEQSAFLGYNTHFPNYELAWNFSEKGNEYLTKTHFLKAASRFPSPFAFINYTNLDMDINLSKVQATLTHAANTFDHGEIKNNLGLLRVQTGELGRALNLFREAESSDTWNQAPLLNKWAVLGKMKVVDSSSLNKDYLKGNFGVKANILAGPQVDELNFTHDQISSSPLLHQHAFLLNALTHFDHDSLSDLTWRLLEHSSNANFNTRLRKGLAINYYKNGRVNKAFRLYDYLQNNTYQLSVKGDYLNELGILALDQGAGRLALDFFDKAAENESLDAEINRLEALFRIDRSKEIPDELLKIVKKDPGLTQLANRILEQLESVGMPTDVTRSRNISFSDLSDEELIRLGELNAFDVFVTLGAVKELNKRDNIEAYNIILEAIEINPYSVPLMKQFTFVALDQNLSYYAGNVIERLGNLMEPSAFDSFIKEYDSRKEALDKDSDWQ